MDFIQVFVGKDVFEDIFVVIEILVNVDLIKYEIDKDSNVVFVDCFMVIFMFYLVNYGYIFNILFEDGDLLDVLVVIFYLVVFGFVICCCLVGVFNMIDEVGKDVKLVVVFYIKFIKFYDDVKEIDDLLLLLLVQIKYFFENYKDLEEGKWVKVDGWDNVVVVKEEIFKFVVVFEKK